MGIERSAGFPVQAGGVTYGMAGGGWSGVTAELDETVLQAAEALTAAYDRDVEIRFNSDRESGGAWLKTPDGFSAHVGIGASLVTARTRDVWQMYADRYAREVETGLTPYDGDPLTADERDAARECMESYLGSLERCPEGLLTVYAHIDGRAVRDPQKAAALVQLGYWNDMGSADYRDGYHHDDAGSVSDALARCLRFVPWEEAR